MARGTLRIGGEEISVSQGDYVALPARAQAAHQLVNDSGAVLRYLCFSTMVEPDVIVYPDSGKVGIFGGAAPGDRRRSEPSASSSEGRPRSATMRAKSSGAHAVSILASEGYKQNEATAIRSRPLAGLACPRGLLLVALWRC